MPIYRYSALNQMGKRVSGVVHADTADIAMNQLKKEKLFLTKIREESTAGVRLTSAQLLTFTREMTQLLKAGLPLFESLLTLEEKYRKHKSHPIFLDLCDRLKGGSSLSLGMKKQSSTFDPVYCAMIESAEQGASLPAVFDQLTLFQARNMRLKKRLISAFTYPAILFGFSIAVVFLLLTFVIPQMRDLFEGRNVHIMTRIVLGLSSFIEQKAAVILTVFCASVVGGVLLLRRESVKRRMEALSLKIPLIKTLIMQSAVSRFTRTASFLLQTGVPLVTALRLSRGSFRFSPLTDVVKQAEDYIVQGGKLSQVFQKAIFLPPILFRMIAIGEETGHLAKMFGHLADITDEELERNLDQLTTLLQPLLLILMGGIVGLVLLSVLLPLTDVGSFIEN